MLRQPKLPSAPVAQDDTGDGDGFRKVLVIAVAASLIWACVAIYVATASTPPDGSLALRILLWLLPPLLLIWGGVVATRFLALRDETLQLRHALEELRAAQGMPLAGNAPADAAASEAPPRVVEPKAAPARATTAARVAPAGPAAARPMPQLRAPARGLAAAPARPASAVEPPSHQPDLPLDANEAPQQPPLSPWDLIRGLQFPDSAEDQDGIRALRMALADPVIARLIRAAQDVLTLLSQEGIYMDDLRPAPADPESWRRFARGERGETIAAMGAVLDTHALQLTMLRMREDTIFRDAMHHFLRSFDRNFQEFERTASDEELIALADTRTARAFMLCARAAGVFGPALPPAPPPAEERASAPPREEGAP